MAPALRHLCVLPPPELRRCHVSNPLQLQLLPRQLRPNHPNYPLLQPRLPPHLHDRVPGGFRRVATALLLPRRSGPRLRQNRRRPRRFGLFELGYCGGIGVYSRRIECSRRFDCFAGCLRCPRRLQGHGGSVPG